MTSLAHNFALNINLMQTKVSMLSYLEFIEVTTDGVIKQLNCLKSSKSPGPDALRKEDLIIDPIMTAKYLAEIFNASLKNSELPRDWKMAHVAPLPKKGGHGPT